MEARIGKELAGARAADEGRGLALDLTASEVVLHDGSAAGGWCRFAGVALDDPEFLEVIALLRQEAESQVGRGRPVLLWLPSEQVLRLQVRIEGREPRARLAAAFRIASRETGHAAGELAVALGPAGPAGEATLLVTYAATWHEARDYAARWGFVPGAVSTRHHAEAFGPEGPDFRVSDAAGEAEAKAGPRLAWLAIGLVAVIAAAAPEPAAARAPQTAPLPEVRGAVAQQAAETVAETPAERPAETAGETPAETAAETPAETPVDTGGFAAVMPPARPASLGGAPEPATGARAAPSGTAAPPGTGAPADTPDAPGATGLRVEEPERLRAPPPPPRPAGLVPALRLDRAALIGILNLDSGREALLRLPNGEVVTLHTGEVLDGWEVTAIGTDTMQVRRGTRTLTLLLVSG